MSNTMQITLKECQAKAQEYCFDPVTFDVYFPNGKMKCQWLDSAFGFFTVEGLDGFISIQQIDEMFPDGIMCDNFKHKGDE